MEYEVEVAGPRGRPKKTWREIVEKDCQACKLNREDASVLMNYSERGKDRMCTTTFTGVLMGDHLSS